MGKEIEELKLELYKLLRKYIKNGDLCHSVYEIFLRRKYCEKYNPELSSFRAFVNRYYRYILWGIYKKAKHINKVRLIEGYNDIDMISVEDNLVKNEMLDEVYDYFTEDEIRVMQGDLTQSELSREKGCSRQKISISFKHRLEKFRKTR